MTNALLDIPKSVKKGEIFTIKIVLSHIMETGYRRDISGKVIPRNIVHALHCTYDNAVVFKADLTQAIAANPYFGFTTTATRSGPVIFSWRDDEGKTYTQESFLQVAD